MNTKEELRNLKKKELEKATCRGLITSLTLQYHITWLQSFQFLMAFIHQEVLAGTHLIKAACKNPATIPWEETKCRAWSTRRNLAVEILGKAAGPAAHDQQGPQFRTYPELWFIHGHSLGKLLLSLALGTGTEGHISQTSCGCPSSGSAQGQLGCGLENIYSLF